MLKRFWILTVLLALLPLSGCKKSEGIKIENFFGAPPAMSEVSLTKERRDFDCVLRNQDLCSQSVCLGMFDSGYWASIDLLTASAKVVDATPPDATYPTDILVVVLRFLDPPPGVQPGASILLFSLEMFDTGPVVVGTVSASYLTDVYSGDQVAGDGTFTRKFYFGTTTELTAGYCIEDTDRANLSHTYSTYGTSLDVAPSATVEFLFKVQAIDRAGNIATSTEYPLPIQGTFRDTVGEIAAACIIVNGECFPP